MTTLSPERVRAEPLLEVDASKSFGGVPALRGASLSVLAGEVHALMGENGAGKSTLIKILAGVLEADALTLRVRGSPASLRSPADAHRLGLRFIHQELNTVPNVSVAENIYLGQPYPRTALGTVDWPELRRRAGATLAGLGVTHIAPGSSAGGLAPGDAMLVAIARAFVEPPRSQASARLYVLDEPTAALSRAETELLFGVIRGLKARGFGVVYVSHRLEEIFELSDRITVLRDGRAVATAATADASRAELIAQMTGRAPGEAYPTRKLEPTPPPVLAVEGVANARVRDVSLTLHGGEVVGIAGLAGSGRTELLRLLAGADPAWAGAVELDGKRVRLNSPGRAWRYGVAFVPEERRSQGLVMTASVRANTVLPHLASLSRLGFARRRRERRLTERLARELRLKARSPEGPVRDLSGGNQQKVVLARALAANPSVLLLDEPTRGVDAGAKYDVYTFVLEAAARGAAVLMASSDLPELLGLCSRVLVMKGGRITREVPTRGLTQAALLSLCYDEAA